MGVICSKKKRERAHTDDAIQRVISNRGSIVVGSRYHKGRDISDDYELQKSVLGTGFSGSVKVCKSKATGTRHAVKALKTTGVDLEQLKMLEAETEIFLSMDHPHVACLEDVYEMGDKIYFVMELLEGGELFTRLAEKDHYSEFDAAQATHQMLLAISYLHAHNIAHRDLKLENFLYEKKKANHLKLIDFGFSKVRDPNVKMEASCGTISYVAPEVLSGSYTEKCDLWSLGVIVYMMLAGRPPFNGIDDEGTVKLIMSGNYKMRKKEWTSTSEQARQFVRALLVVDPAKRLNAHQALEHPWISNKDEFKNTRIDVQVLTTLQQFTKATHFRRACMMMMAWSMSVEEREKVRNIFLALDKDNSGTISLAELKNVLQNQSGTPIRPEMVTELFESLSQASADHEINYRDYLAAVAHSRVAFHNGEVREIFRRFDTDHTGFITVDNLSEVLGGNFEGADLEDLIKEADTDRNGNIDYEELLAYLRRGPDEKHQVPDGNGQSHQEIHLSDDDEEQTGPSTNGKSEKQTRHEKHVEMISQVVDTAVCQTTNASFTAKQSESC
eukprot:gnl/MRDRNA2_/MRDRNA2_77925_c0_seq1.p1 gnl/MRDRNA2_/MRDRNA2_77925_c0~~gnl/MRDRNA2_/MRDRNA2_77925_c0_seq1.p1  ORF type:complete len:557 (+),score=100.85 gnl/MRDRNA2_/MRDRNA2_77925_c0_seq1:124-1794(+)